MGFSDKDAVFGFVWRPDQAAALSSAANWDSGSVPIIDCRTHPSGPLLDDLKSSRHACRFHIVAEGEGLVSPPFLERLRQSGAARVWAPLPPALDNNTLGILTDVFASGGGFFVPVVSQVAQLEHFLQAGLPALALKGSEAAGFVGSESTLTLFSSARAIGCQAGHETDLYIWGGIGTPKAAAAFLAAGVQGVIFESLHWLTLESGFNAVQREKIASLRTAHTDIIAVAPQAWCRVFDKGNNSAVQKLKSLAASFDPSNDRERPRFETELKNLLTAPAQSAFRADELIPLGIEAAFARSFVERYGDAAGPAIEAFGEETRALAGGAGERKRAFLDGPILQEFGTRYPFVQGAMTWITDSLPFARAVADAGGLPTLALGVLDEPALEDRFQALTGVLGGRPYAVNILGLAENPARDVQLAWIRKHRPPFVVLSAGPPSLAEQIRGYCGGIIYVSSNEDLLRLAFEMGIRHVICEGSEAGGHIGRYTTLTFGQSVIELRRRNPDLFKDRRVLLAGGIFDADTVSIAALLGAEAVQMGTAYLATKEIVQTGALTAAYQRLVVGSRPGGTTVTGASVGLSIRALDTPRIRVLKDVESSLARGDTDEPSLRKRLEKLAAGSLYLAARGRRPEDGVPLDDPSIVSDGQFMCGACAGAIQEVLRLEEFHERLVSDLLGTTGREKPRRRALLRRPASSANGGHERIAITGISVSTPLGHSPEELWNSSLALKSGVTGIPDSRWDHSRYFDPRPHTPDRTCCKVAAFKNLEIDRKLLRIPPHDFRTMANSTRETLYLAEGAIREAGLLDSGIPPDRVSIVLSQNAGEFSSRLSELVSRSHAVELLRALQKTVSTNAELESALRRELESQPPPIDDTTLVGRLNATAVGFISNRYGFRGPSLALTAACASSLAAIYHAIHLIRSGIIDAAVVGGGEERLSPFHFLEFSALGALAGQSGVSRPPSEACRPFDRCRDGIVLGEGGGMVVIERESVAAHRGAPIHAFITGMGASNNHLGLVESSSITQREAIEKSFHDVGDYGPESVELVECHATGTPQGDREELLALRQEFANTGRTVITSLKSQIGHTLGAAGINSLSRGISAVKAGVFPPTLNFLEFDPDIELGNAQLVVAKAPMEWKAPRHGPRRFQVNSFGFGGFNYVLQLEAAKVDSDVVLVKSDSHRTASASQPTPLERTPQFPAKDAVAFLYPGQGSQYPGMGRRLYEHFPEFRKCLDDFARLMDFDLLDFLFQSADDDLRETSRLQPALFAVEYALTQQLRVCGLTPRAVAGHSLGEFTALCVAGVFSPEDGLKLVTTRALLMKEAAARAKCPGGMLAVEADPGQLSPLLADWSGIHIANLNSPRQVVVAGDREELDAFAKRLTFASVPLKVNMAFHSPSMRGLQDKLAAVLTRIPLRAPEIPVMSNVTGGAYPSDRAGISDLLTRQLESPVQWVECVKALRLRTCIQRFVEVGPGSVLTNLMRDSFPDAVCTITCPPSRAAGDAIEPLLEGAAYPLPSPSKSDPGPLTRPSSSSPDSRLVLDEVIRIIMDATGYEKSEIGPDMDLRDSLAIRSSRFPVILDAAEKRFGVAIRFQDLMGVRTVRDAANCISRIIQRGDQTPAVAGVGTSLSSRLSTTRPEQPRLKRTIFDDRRLPMGTFTPVALERGQKVFLAASGRSSLSKRIRRVLVDDYGLVPVSMGLSDGPDRMLGFRDDASMAGLIVVADRHLRRKLETLQHVSNLLTRFFSVLKTMVTGRGGCSFVFLAQERADPSDNLTIFIEGVKGLLLTAAMEHPSVQFRCLELDDETDPSYAVRCALDRSRSAIDQRFREGEALSPSGIVSPLEYCGSGPLALGPEDVVVLSGGAKGITAHLARALRPFGCRLALLGRTPAPEQVNDLMDELARDSLEVAYHQCDVTDPRAVAETLGEIVHRCGRIDGIIHGAAVLRDRLIANTSEVDFAAVLDVKLLGAWNLVTAAAEISKPRFFVALSSIVAAIGNVGQAAYSSANRAMAALMTATSLRQSDTLLKALLIPPVEGAGSAASPEIRQLLKQRGMEGAYITVNELRELFLRELFLNKGDRSMVMFTRSLPEIPAAVIDPTEPAPDSDRLDAPAIRFPRDRFPLVDSIDLLNLDECRIETVRAFSSEQDLWLEDHRPFPSSPAPLLSGVMTIEALLEASTLLFPYLTPTGIRDVRFVEPVPCLAGTPSVCRISCNLFAVQNRLTIVEASLRRAGDGDGSLPGAPCARGRVMMGSTRPSQLPASEPVGDKATEAEYRSLDEEQMTRLYRRMTGFGKRYQVLNGLSWTESGVAASIFVERDSRDFRDFQNTNYQNSPYLLEAVLHLAGFFAARSTPDSDHILAVVPAEIGEIAFARKAESGEALDVRVALREASGERFVFDGHCCDRAGFDLIQVRGLCMVAIDSGTAKAAFLDHGMEPKPPTGQKGGHDAAGPRDS